MFNIEAYKANEKNNNNNKLIDPYILIEFNKYVKEEYQEFQIKLLNVLP